MECPCGPLRNPVTDPSVGNGMIHASQGTHPPVLLCRLQAAKREAVEHFFLREMDDVGLYLRFFRTMTPATVHAYVMQIPFSREGAVFGARIGERLVGVAELAAIPGSGSCLGGNRLGGPMVCAELGIAVAGSERRKGIARQLLQRLLRHAWDHGLKRVELSSLKENHPMLRLAESLGFRAVREETGEIIMQAPRPADWPLDAVAVAAEEAATADCPAEGGARDAKLACPVQMLKGRCE